MKYRYETMIREIRVPPGLHDRVLAAAEEERAPTSRRPLLRAAVCALCAVVLVAGGVGLRPDEEMPDVERMEYSLGLPVYAAEACSNGAVLLEMAEGQSAEALHGTTQTLALTFADGREETGTYYLRAEKLRAYTNEDGKKVLVPVLQGDPAETVSGLYAVPEDSVWFSWPVESSSTVSLSAPYGKRELVLTSDPPQAVRTMFHSGIDIPAERGTNIAAALGGTVVETGFNSTRGNYLILDHGGGLTTLYGHCQALLAEEGAAVEPGEAIATVGATGMATGPHLHFEVRQDGEAQNPIAYFPAEIRDTLKTE